MVGLRPDGLKSNAARLVDIPGLYRRSGGNRPADLVGNVMAILQNIIRELETPSGQIGPLSQAYGRGAVAAWRFTYMKGWWHGK